MAGAPGVRGCCRGMWPVGRVPWFLSFCILVYFRGECKLNIKQAFSSFRRVSFGVCCLLHCDIMFKASYIDPCSLALPRSLRIA